MIVSNERLSLMPNLAIWPPFFSSTLLMRLKFAIRRFLKVIRKISFNEHLGGVVNLCAKKQPSERKCVLFPSKEIKENICNVNKKKRRIVTKRVMKAAAAKPYRPQR